MTVKSLSSLHKDQIASLFLQRAQTLDQLANFYGRSRRTIVRALEEKGVDPKIKKRGPRKPKVQASSMDYGMHCPQEDLVDTRPMGDDFREPVPMIEFDRRRWYHRVLQFLSDRLLFLRGIA